MPALAERVTRCAAALDADVEIVAVDDGSRDRTGELLRDWAKRDARVVVLVFARNFGHQMALSAGLEEARGEVVALLDGDLQDPPELLPEMLARWRAGFDVVYGVRRNRQEGLLLRGAYALFYRLLRRAAQIDIPLDAGDFCLLDRRVVDVLVALPERSRFLRGLRSWTGFRQAGLPYDRAPRAGGRPKYTWRPLVELGLDGIVSFSHLPLRLARLARLRDRGARARGARLLLRVVAGRLRARRPAAAGRRGLHDADDAAALLRGRAAPLARPARRVRRAHLRRGEAAARLDRRGADRGRGQPPVRWRARAGT